MISDSRNMISSSSNMISNSNNVVSSSNKDSSESTEKPGDHSPLTLYDKLWQSHLVRLGSGMMPSVLYIDLHLIHEVTSPQAFAQIKGRGLKVARPDRTFATMDHSIPTTGRLADGTLPVIDSSAAMQLDQLARNCKENGIQLFDITSTKQGIVHVIGPELGLTQPGMTIVCGDSHSSTHGAFGSLAFGIGTSEVAHVLATQCLLQKKSKSMRINIDGIIPKFVSAKDVILYVISKLGVGGATGHVIEYAGSTVRAMSMDERMTLCNMSIEAGARAGIIAPDDTTFQYIAGREFAPTGQEFDRSVEIWRRLVSDSDAVFDIEIDVDVSNLTPMVTYGTNPGMGMQIEEAIPYDAGISQALEYMKFQSGDKILGAKIDIAFLGSCTNSRLSDLQAAAEVIQGQKVAAGVKFIVVPGSKRVKSEAEALGLDKIFIEAGAEWREPGCSMCLAMNGDTANRGQLVISTSNRNFEGRQGAGSRTVLASPITVAASAIAGSIADARYIPELMGASR